MRQTCIRSTMRRGQFSTPYIVCRRGCEFCATIAQSFAVLVMHSTNNAEDVHASCASARGMKAFFFLILLHCHVILSSETCSAALSAAWCLLAAAAARAAALPTRTHAMGFETKRCFDFGLSFSSDGGDVRCLVVWLVCGFKTQARGKWDTVG